jgi:simple sugar transport system permease protein
VATGSALLGVLAAILVGMLVGLFFALFVVKFKSDEFIIGTALNILADGLTVFLLWALFNVRGTLRTEAALPTIRLLFHQSHGNLVRSTHTHC